MGFSTLKDVYIDQLQDLHSADKQAMAATEKLAELAHNADLKSALQRGVKGIKEGKETLATIIRGHKAEPQGEFCKGMEGLVKEVRAHVIDAKYDNPEARDAMIIAQYQRMAHYAIAGYGCCSAYARRLELHSDADKLQKCLDDTYHGDKEMTSIALGEVNKAAAA